MTEELNLEPFIDRRVYVKLFNAMVFNGVLRTNDGIDFMVYDHKTKFLSIPFAREDITAIGKKETDVR